MAGKMPALLASKSMESYLDPAIEIAREAGGLLGQLSKRPHEITYKRPSDIVTEADRRSEALIVERLLSRFPRHAIVSEEGGGQQTDSITAGMWIRWTAPRTSPTDFRCSAYRSAWPIETKW